MTHARLLVLALAVSLPSTACSKDDAPAAPAPPSRFALVGDPGGGMSVLEARKAAPKPDVVVVGRVREITKGLAAFTLIDVSLKYCGQTQMEGCPTPWDYCCIPAEEVASRSIGVRVRERGAVVKVPSIPELRNLDLVAVKGVLVKDKDEVFLDATGWYRRERPALDPSIRFPQ